MAEDNERLVSLRKERKELEARRQEIKITQAPSEAKTRQLKQISSRLQQIDIQSSPTGTRKERRRVSRNTNTNTKMNANNNGNNGNPGGNPGTGNHGPTIEGMNQVQLRQLQPNQVPNQMAWYGHGGTVVQPMQMNYNPSMQMNYNPMELMHAFARGLSGGNATVNLNMPGSSMNMNVSNHNNINSTVLGDNSTLGSNATEIPESVRRTLERINSLFGDEMPQDDRDRFFQNVQRLAYGANKDGNSPRDDENAASQGDNASHQRHQELLTRFGLVLEAVKKQPAELAAQMQEENGPFQEAVRSAVKSSSKMRRNFNDSGEDISDRFEKAAFSSPGRSAPAPAQPSAQEKYTIFQEMVKESKPAALLEALMMAPPEDSSILHQGVAEHFENILTLMAEIRDGQLQVPAVNKDGLQALRDAGSPTAKLCELMGDKVFLDRECFVSISCSDSIEVNEDGEQVRSEVLQVQRVPCCIGQSLELLYEDDDETVIDFNSVTLSDSKVTLSFVFLTVCSESSELIKCTINAPNDKVCMIDATVLEQISSTRKIILHFNGCELSHKQVSALSNSVECPLVFENSPIDELEDKLFSGASPLKVAFKGSCPKFRYLLPHVQKGGVSALMLQKIDLLYVYGGIEQVAGALKELNALVRAAASVGCDIAIGELTVGDESIKNEIDENHRHATWKENESINLISDLGNSGQLASISTAEKASLPPGTGNSGQLASRSTAEKASLPPGTGNSCQLASIPTAEKASLPLGTARIVDKKGRTMERRGTDWCFTGYQKEPFTIPIGEKTHAGDFEVALRCDGVLEYKCADNSIVWGKVPATASPAKYWCMACGSSKTTCGKH